MMLAYAKFLGLPLLLAATAATPPAVTDPPLPANARALLKGTWVSTEDKDNSIVITDKQYIEKYKGEPDQVHRLTVLTHPCNEKPTAKPSGELYLKTMSSAPDAEPYCYAVYQVSATRLATSMMGGRGNTLSFKRVMSKSPQK